MTRIHTVKSILLVGAATLSPTDAFSSTAIRHAVKQQAATSSTLLRYRSNVTEAEVVSPFDLATASNTDVSPIQDLLLSQDVSNLNVGEEKKEGMSDVVKARLLLLGASALYGTNFSLVKILGETGMSIGLSSTVRFGMAALALLPFLLRLQDESNGENRFQKLFDPKSVEFQAALGGLEVGMFNSIGYVGQAVGLETTSASKSAFLCSMAVVIVPLLDYISGKTLLSRQVIGALLAMVGVGFLELEGTGSSMDSLSGGDIASLIQPLAFGLGFWRMEATMHKFPEEAGRVTAAQLLAVFLGSAGYTMAMGVINPATLPTSEDWLNLVTDPTIMLALFWTGVVTTALTIFMETVALKTLSAADTTLIMSTEPLWGTAFACAVMGETMGINAGVGAVMILAGCLFSNLGLRGFMSLLSGSSKNPDIEAMQKRTSGELERFELLDQTPISGQNILPTTTAGKLSLKSTVAGAMTGIVAIVESASGHPPTFEPDELREFIESLSE